MGGDSGTANLRLTFDGSNTAAPEFCTLEACDGGTLVRFTEQRSKQVHYHGMAGDQSYTQTYQLPVLVYCVDDTALVAAIGRARAAWHLRTYGPDKTIK